MTMNYRHIEVFWEGTMEGARVRLSLEFLSHAHLPHLAAQIYKNGEWKSFIFKSVEVQQVAYEELVGPCGTTTVSERDDALLDLALPLSWTTLEDRIDRGDADKGWVKALAWAVAGGDPDGLDIRLYNGRALYEAAWVVHGPRGGERVRLARVESKRNRVHETVRWVSPNALLEVRRSDA